MMLCANAQGLNLNALVSSGLAPVFSPEEAKLVLKELLTAFLLL